jgi:hypothetical protein
LSSCDSPVAVRASGFLKLLARLSLPPLALWQQGFADQAKDCAAEGLALAESARHALSLCFVLAHAVAPIALWRGELTTASEMTRLLLARSEEHSFLIWHGFGQAYQAVLQSDPKCGLDPVHPAMGALLLDTLATLDEAMAGDEILARGENGFAGWCTPELLRIRAKRLFQSDEVRAETLLLRSLDAARQQGALSWERDRR